MKLLATALLGGVLMVAGWSVEKAYAEPTDYYRDQKVVYHNDGGGPDSASYFMRMLNS